MSTLRQRLRYRRTTKTRSSQRPALSGCPFRRGVCLRVFTTTPKKPNSAIRKVVRVARSNRQRITAYVPGERHTIQKHVLVLVRGGNVADLPGVRYKVVRGKLDVTPVALRKTKRSKYGVRAPRPK